MTRTLQEFEDSAFVVVKFERSSIRVNGFLTLAELKELVDIYENHLKGSRQ